MEQEINRYDLTYKTSNKKYNKTNDFQKFKVIKSFGRESYKDVITLNDAFEEQINLKNEIGNFNEYTKPKNQSKEGKKY